MVGGGVGRRAGDGGTLGGVAELLVFIKHLRGKDYNLTIMLVILQCS